MAAHLQEGPLDPQVRALALGALELCESRLEHADPREPREWASRVHDTRRKLKWLRSVLRAVRPSLDQSTFRSEDHALRDAGRKLAEARAQVARAACLRALCAHFSLAASDVEGELRFIESSAAHGGASDTEGARADLGEAKGKNLAFLPEIDPETLVTGLSDQLRHARKAYRRARRSPTSHLLHEWRKQVKYHLHQLELLRQLVPDLAERTARMKALSELLGQAHDVADLRHHLAAFDRDRDGARRPDLQALLDAREAELALRALSEGRTLFKLKPRELRALVERQLSAQ